LSSTPFPPLIPPFLPFFPSRVHMLILSFAIPPMHALAPGQAATHWRSWSLPLDSQLYRNAAHEIPHDYAPYRPCFPTATSHP
jgi:hypothetical protein